MTKAQKIIILAVAVLLALSVLFPPQYSGVFVKDGKVVKAVLKSGLNNNITEIIKDVSERIKGRFSFSFFIVDPPQHDRLGLVSQDSRN